MSAAYPGTLAPFRRILDAQRWRDYRVQGARALAYAVGEGVSFALTVPVLAALLRGDVVSAGWWCAALAVAVVVTLVLHDRQTVAGLRATFEAVESLHTAIARCLASRPADVGPGAGAGGSLGEVDQLAWPGLVNPTRQVLLNLAPLARGVVGPLAVLAVTAAVDPRPAVVMGVVLVALAVVHRAGAAVVERAEASTHAAQSEAADRIVEFAACQATLRSTRSGELGLRLLTDALDDLDRRSGSAVVREMLARTATGVAVALGLAAVLAALAWTVGGGTDDVVLLAAVAVLLLRFAEPLREVADLLRVLRTARAYAVRTAAVLDAPALPVADPPASPPPADRPAAVDLRGVAYRYPGAPADALTGVDLHVPAGTRLALVGASGAGKSTVLRLLARLGDAHAGSVTVGGVDVRDLEPDALYRVVGVALQDVVLTEGTVRDAVVASRPDADDAAVARAAALAGVDEVVARLPQGWDTPVGARGARLSGGERARVQLARVALQDPPVVLLDEVTAALDPRNERVVRRWVAAMAGRRTVVVVAHRLASVVDADAIALVADGRIVEHGTHDRLLADGGVYARLWRTGEDPDGWRASPSPSPHPGGAP